MFAFHSRVLAQVYLRKYSPSTAKYNDGELKEDGKYQKMMAFWIESK